MGNFQFNISKGRAGTYFQNVEDGTPATSRIIVVPIETNGSLDTDDALNNYTTLSALLAPAGNNEQTTMGRKTLTAAEISLTIDNTANHLELDLTSSITWTAATGSAISDLLFCYDPDPGDGDTDIIPLFWYDFTATPSGIDIIVSAHVNGLIRIT